MGLVKTPTKRVTALTPKQSVLLNLIENSNKYEWIGYGGARGGAKSFGIREIALYLGLRYNVQILIFRRYRQELLDNHVYPLLIAHPEIKKHFNKSELILFHPKTKQPIIKFGYADRLEDVYKEQGNQYAIIFIDEATQSTQEMIQWLSTSNRDPQGLFPSIPKMVLTMNPGGVGHSYIKRIFIDKMHLDNEDPDSYAFIQSHVWDNVFWSLRELFKQGYDIDDYYYRWTEQQRKDFCVKYSTYAKRLSGLPEQLKLAYLFGDWDVFGGMFFQGINLKEQVIEPFTIPLDWKLYASLDPGYSSPLSFSIGTVDFMNNYYRVWTYYERGKDPYQHAKDISNYLTSERSIVNKILRGRKPELIVSGKDAWAKKDRYAIKSSDKTMAEVFSEYGLDLSPAVTDRIPGWWNMKSYLTRRDEDDNYKYMIFGEYVPGVHLNMPYIDELSSANSDPKYPEDLLGKGNDPAVMDHALDEERYKLMAIDEVIPKIETHDFAWVDEMIKRNRRNKKVEKDSYLLK